MDPVSITNVALTDSALMALSTSLCLLPDGLECVVATVVQTASHTPSVVGSARQSIQRTEFRCVKTPINSLKIAVSGMHRSLDFDKYIHRYLAEVQYRFNRRHRSSTFSDRRNHATWESHDQAGPWRLDSNSAGSAQRNRFGRIAAVC